MLTEMKSMASGPADIRNMRWHAGSLIRVIAKGRATNEEMAAVESIFEPGAEPPPHAHSNEDEAVYVMSGEVEFTVGRRRVRAGEGEWVTLPRDVRHSFEVLSDRAHLLTMYTPGGIEGFFEMLSEPAEDSRVPASSLSYDNLFDMEYIMHVGREFGIKFYPSLREARMARSAAA